MGNGILFCKFRKYLFQGDLRQWEKLISFLNEHTMRRELAAAYTRALQVGLDPFAHYTVFGFLLQVLRFISLIPS